ncbi:MAG: hypothetical protein M1444_01655 [Patescibacteria group bacterium]|nr:hypothetical protein [Patescibacteria group bacterium]
MRRLETREVIGNSARALSKAYGHIADMAERSRSAHPIVTPDAPRANFGVPPAVPTPEPVAAVPAPETPESRTRTRRTPTRRAPRTATRNAGFLVTAVTAGTLLGGAIGFGAGRLTSSEGTPNVPAASQTLEDSNPSSAPASAPAASASTSAEAPANLPVVPELPKTLAEARNTLIASLGGNINPDMISLGVKRDGSGNVVMQDGKPVSDGTIQIEAFPLKAGVKFDGTNYIDSKGNPVYKQEEIYDFTQKPEWINRFTLNLDGVYIFARIGGLTPKGQENQANISRFVGTKDVTIKAPIEQMAIILATECPTDTATAAWRDAVGNFAWNRDAQNGTVKIEWYNAQTQKLELLDGRTITALAKVGRDLSILSELSAGYPITPDQAAKATGGTTGPEQWFLDPITGVWTYEGFGLNNGVRFDAKSGVFRNKRGDVLTDPSKIFNFDRYDLNTWPTTMTAADTQSAYTFFRTGGGSKDQPNTSWYGFPNATVSLQRPGIEQAAIIPPMGCLTLDAVRNAAAADANGAARNNAITVMLWDGSQFQPVTSN